MELLADEFITLESDTPLTPGIWHHIAGTYDGFVMQILLDGLVVKQIHVEGTLQKSNSDELWIGGNPNAVDTTFCGAIDEVRIWSTVRGPEDIQRTMNAPLKGDEPGLAAYYQFTRGTEGADSSPNGNDGTFVGAAGLVDWF
jgi:hypothetical protein